MAKLSAPTSPRLHAVDLEDVSVRFGRHWALDAATIRIEAGQRWLLLGANGAGKTVLLKLLRGDVWPTPTGRGHRQYRAKDGTHLHTAAARERIAYLGPERQDKYERYQWNSTVVAVVGKGFADTEQPLDRLTAAQSRRVVRVLGEVGLRGLAKRRFLTLSYGQRRRVLLARSLMRRPDLLLLDEALNGLDRRSRTVFLRVLHRSLPASTAWVLSSHRPLDRATAATHVARIDRGRIVSSGPFEPRTAAPVGSKRTAPSRGGSRRGVSLKLANVTVYRDYRPVVACLDLEVREGEHWAVVGPNGSGKSTLMALLYGDLSPALGGRLERSGFPGGSPISEWKARVGFVSPELQADYSATACTALEIIASGLHSSIGLDEPVGTSERRLARAWLRRVGLAGLAGRRARELSYGQLRRALVARALVRERDLLLLDEPYDGLDDEGRTLVHSLVGAAIRKGAQLILATHHREDVPGYVRRVLALRADGNSRIISRR